MSRNPVLMLDPVPELIRLLGQPVVFIDWPKGSKGTNKPWGHLRAEHMTPEHLAKLPAGNIGVALGAVSGGLCVIDIDLEEFVEPFLALNPELRDTLQTHGARGRSIWVRFDGEYPKLSSKLKNQAGREIGEFRSNRNQSIVWGTHPDTGKPYTFVVQMPAVSIKYASIQWPPGVSNPPAVQSDRVTE